MLLFQEMEYEFVKWFVPHAKDALLGKDEMSNAIETLQNKRNAIQKRIETTIDLLDAGVAVNEIKSRLLKLENEKQSVENDLATTTALQSSKASLPETLKQLETLIDGVRTNQAIRKQVSSLVPSIVQSVVIDISNRDFPSFTCHLVNGATINWTYNIIEYAQPIIGVTKDGHFILGKGKVTDGHFEQSNQ